MRLNTDKAITRVTALTRGTVIRVNTVGLVLRTQY